MTLQNQDRKIILIVDDTPDNIMLLSRLLKDKYHTKVATNGSTALQIAHATPSLDLILLDVMMPGMDGYETCRQLKADPRTAKIPVIFLTAKSQVEDEAKGLTLGAVDYLTKPISPPILFARVATQLTLARAHQQQQDQNAHLERIVHQGQAQLRLVRDATIMAMATLAAARHGDTAQQLGLARDYVHALASHLRSHPRFAPELSEENIALIYKAAPLHEPHTALKPGKLDPDILDAFVDTQAGFNESAARLAVVKEDASAAQSA